VSLHPFIFIVTLLTPISLLFPTRRSSDLDRICAGRSRRDVVSMVRRLPQLPEADASPLPEKLRSQDERHSRRRLHADQPKRQARSEEHTSELQSRRDSVCRLLLEKKKRDH